MDNEYHELVALQPPILNILTHNPAIYDQFAHDLKIADFTLPQCQSFFEALRTYRNVCPKKVPTIRDIGVALYRVSDDPNSESMATEEHTPAIKKLLNHVFSGAENPEFFVESIPRYVKKVRYLQLVEQQSYMDPEVFMQKMTELQRLEIGPGSVKENHECDPWSDSMILFEDDPNRQVAVPTGIKKLDANISGGLCPGEMGIVTASSGVGKTNSLLNFANGAVTLGFHALIFSLEIGQQTMARRYQAITSCVPFRLLDIPVQRWPDKLLRYRKQLMLVRDSFQQRSKEGVPPLKIIAITDKKLNSAQIREYVLRWQDQVVSTTGGLPLAVYVDWLEYVDTVPGLIRTKNPEKHELLGEVAKQMRSVIAQECGVALWSACQANRGAANKTSLTMADIGKAYSINEPLDINLGLTAPEDKELQDQMGATEGEDKVEHALQRVRRCLHMNSMKNRKSVPVGFELTQSESLRFWTSDRECNEFEQRLSQGELDILL